MGFKTTGKADRKMSRSVKQLADKIMPKKGKLKNRNNSLQDSEGHDRDATDGALKFDAIISTTPVDISLSEQYVAVFFTVNLILV